MLQQAHTTLEQRVEERTTALQQAEHFALLGRLAASVSHDLRNPLAAIVLQVEVLEAEWQTPSAEETAVISEAFTEIKLQLARLQELVRELSLLAHATGPWSSVQAWAQEIVAAHRGQVTVHSVIGQGTTFTITLPCSTAERLPSPLNFSRFVAP